MWIRGIKMFIYINSIFILILFMTGCGKKHDKQNKQVVTSNIMENSNIAKISGYILNDNEEEKTDKAGVLVTAYRSDMIPDINDKKNANRKNFKTTPLSEGIYQTTTDSLGYFELEIPFGEYTIIVESPNHKKSMKKITAKSSNTTTNFILTETGNITGRIISGNMYYGSYDKLVYIPGTSYIAIPEDDGYFIISSVPTGKYLLNIYNVTKEVTVKPGLNDIGTIDLTSISPEIVDAYPENDSTMTRSFSDSILDLKKGISISFSQWMNRKSVTKAISIKTPNNTLIDWDTSFSFNDGESTIGINIFPRSLEEYNKLPVGEYMVNVSTSAVGINGLPLKFPYTFRFKIVDKVEKTEPINGEKDVFIDIDNPISITFTNEMKRDSVNISINPPVTSILRMWNKIDADDEDQKIIPYDELKIYGGFSLDTTYTVTITQGNTIKGDSISPMPYTFKFTTSNQKITGTNPDDKAKDVPKDNKVKIYYNAVMDRDSVEKDLIVKEEDSVINKDNVIMRWIAEKTLEISFQKQYGKTYTISITGARTSQGIAVSDYTFSFTVLLPRIIYSNPSNGAIISLWDDIEIKPNVSIDRNTLNKNNIIMIDQNNNNIPIDIDISSSSIPTIYIIPETLKSSTFYTISIKNIKAHDGTLLPDYVFKFTTGIRRLVWVSPALGSVDVDPNQHSVFATINDSLTDKERTAIQDALVVTAKTYNDNQGITETHPTPLFTWIKSIYDYNNLYMSFTFDKSTNYRIWAKDNNGNPTQDIKDADDNLVLFLDKNNEFTTEYSDNIEQEGYNKHLVYDVIPKDGSQNLDPKNTLVIIHFGTYIYGSKINVYEDDVLIDTTKIIISQKIDKYSYPEIEYHTDAELQFVDEIKYNKSYRVEVISASYDSSSIINNIPFTFSFTTAMPSIYVSIKETDCQIIVKTAGDVFMDKSELTSAFSTQPPVTGEWVIDSTFINNAIYNYDPIQYANMMVNFGEFTAYEQDYDTKEMKSMGKFANTPFSQMFTVNPDITVPELESIIVKKILLIQLLLFH